LWEHKPEEDGKLLTVSEERRRFLHPCTVQGLQDDPQYEIVMLNALDVIDAMLVQRTRSFADDLALGSFRPRRSPVQLHQQNTSPTTLFIMSIQSPRRFGFARSLKLQE
jgi:hypothetical protein